MARPREFNEQNVLNAAVQQFWRYGYEATSVRESCRNHGDHRRELVQCI